MKSILIFLVSTLSLLQTDRIVYIQQRFQEINNNIEKYQKVESSDINVLKDINPNNYSYESTQIHNIATAKLVRYYKGSALVKAEVFFDGDRQNLKSEYYFDSTGLLFVFRQRTDFDEPKWSELFDENDRNVTENRFYFDSGKLIRWINEQGNIKEELTPELSKRSKEVLLDAELYKQFKDI